MNKYIGDIFILAFARLVFELQIDPIITLLHQFDLYILVHFSELNFFCRENVIFSVSSGYLMSFLIGYLQLFVSSFICVLQLSEISVEF